MKILIVMSHPDDEVIFGWPILQDPTYERQILICSSDVNNSKRKWCKHRKDVLYRLCDDLGIECTCLDYDSEFYRLETRPKEKLSDLCSRIIEQIKKLIDIDNFDNRIYTHNMMGEYGHMDHILVHNIIMNNFKSVLISDMYLNSNWMPYGEIQASYRSLYFTPDRLIRSCKLDLDFYNYCKDFYKKAKVWTWNKDPIMECKLYHV